MKSYKTFCVNCYHDPEVTLNKYAADGYVLKLVVLSPPSGSSPAHLWHYMEKDE